MKVKFENQSFFSTLTYPAGSSSDQMDISDYLPDVVPGEAFLFKKVLLTSQPDDLPLGSPAQSATPVDLPIAFAWGILGGKPATGVKLCAQDSLLCYVGRVGGVVVPESEGLRATYSICDNIDFTVEFGTNIIQNYPCRTPHLLFESQGLSNDDFHFYLRLVYDIVALTTTEQSELYQRWGY